MLLSLDPGQWPGDNAEMTDASTSTRPDQVLPPVSGRRLPDIPRDEDDVVKTTSSALSSSEDDIVPIVPMTMNGNKHDAVIKNDEETSCIYQTIGDDDVYSDIENAASEGEAKQEVTEASSILSPFNEHEEWSKISEIINSFGADIGKQTEECKESSMMTTPNNSPDYDYPTLKRREKLAGTIGDWLRYINMEKYISNFESNGYDNLNFMGGGVVTKEELLEIGIVDSKDVSVLFESLKDRKNDFNFSVNQEPRPGKLSKSNIRFDELL